MMIHDESGFLSFFGFSKHHGLLVHDLVARRAPAILPQLCDMEKNTHLQSILYNPRM